MKSRLGFKKYPKEKIDRRIAGEKAYWNNMQSFGHWDEKKLEKAVGYGKFIYYPLHLQPEMTTSVMGGDYKDQMLSIEHLSRILPKGWKIVVKENPKQYYDYYYRGDEFFKRMHSIDNLIFVGKNIDTKWLIKKSCIVATITGTAGWESIRLKRPVLTFGDAWYDGFPGVYKFNPKLNLKEISEEKINPDSIRKHFESWLKNCWVGIVDSDYEMISERSEAVMQQDLMGIFNDLDEITAFKDHRTIQTLRK
ncbi:capsular polysaccharide export protein, LipB/KpsS family [Pelagibaculum spongiae]|uniref:Capsule polysaccharide biosynthesis protein n=1 Tax=Pelagibaculum spongiae TaxID=2080658 RepID=A0A2V1H2G8_9GAMM|nr:hypothetical protein [Pelagibaculum spongiae]PVZ70209.1 hypothetical protein DC094_06290 [Pelagibaculum spongiae]